MNNDTKANATEPVGALLVRGVRALVAALACALAACSVRLENNDILERGDSIDVVIFCPGANQFPGRYVNTKQHTGLTDAAGNPIANARVCAWVKRAP